MPNDQRQQYADWDAAIEKLVAMTKQEEIEWRPWDEFRGRGEDHVIAPAYRTEVNGREIAAYEYTYRYFTDADEWELQTDIAIEFIDSKGRLEYAWQGSPYARRNLLDAIRYRAASVDEFLRAFLSTQE